MRPGRSRVAHSKNAAPVHPGGCAAESLSTKKSKAGGRVVASGARTRNAREQPRPARRDGIHPAVRASDRRASRRRPRVIASGPPRRSSTPKRPGSEPTGAAESAPKKTTSTLERLGLPGSGRFEQRLPRRRSAPPPHPEKSAAERPLRPSARSRTLSSGARAGCPGDRGAHATRPGAARGSAREPSCRAAAAAWQAAARGWGAAARSRAACPCATSPGASARTSRRRRRPRSSAARSPGGSPRLRPACRTARTHPALRRARARRVAAAVHGDGLAEPERTQVARRALDGAAPVLEQAVETRLAGGSRPPRPARPVRELLHATHGTRQGTSRYDQVSVSTSSP